MHKIMEYVCDELEELERKIDKGGKLSMQEIEYLDKLAHIKKSLLSADEMWEDSEYSMARGSYAQGDRGGNRGSRSNMMDGISYARGRRSYAQRRDARGRYSREGGYSMDGDEMIMELRELMQDAPDQQTRQDIQRIVSRLERD